MADILHIIEPEMRTSPPRLVKTSFKTRSLIVCGMIIFTAIFFGGMIALWEGTRLELLAWTGKTVYAHVQSVDAIGKGQGTENTIRFNVAYQFDNPFPNNAIPQLNHSVYEVPVPVQTVKPKEKAPELKPIDISPIKPGMKIKFIYGVVFGQALVYPHTQPLTSKILLMNLMGIVLIAVSIVFMRKIGLWHSKRESLLKYGNAVAGSIVQRRFDNVEGKYYLKYKYFTEPNTPAFELEEQCTDEQWRQFKDDEPVTVLYDPKNHKLAGLYLLLADG